MIPMKWIWQNLIKHPLNLNAVTEEDLMQLHLLSVLQIKNFMSYRKLLGPLLACMNCRRCPDGNLEDIRQLLPFVKIGQDESLYSALKESLDGEVMIHLLIRAAHVLEKSRGFDNPAQPGAQYYMGLL